MSYLKCLLLTLFLSLSFPSVCAEQGAVEPHDAVAQTVRQLRERHPTAKRITISNTLNISRPAETIAIPWNDLSVHPGDPFLRVIDCQTATVIPHQDDQAGALLTSLAFSPRQTRQLLVISDSTVQSADLTPICQAMHIPERMDDFAWENDKMAARAYGPRVSEPPPRGENLRSSGIDIFNKSVPFPVMRQWLTAADGGYHIDRGQGMDNYKVANARGCGGMGVFQNGNWFYTDNWTSAQVLTTGPIRTTFELKYQHWLTKDRTHPLGTETRRVSLDRGQHLARMQSTFSGVREGAFQIGPGLDLAANRQHNGAIALSLNEAWIANFEPKQGKKGSIATAIMLAPGQTSATLASDASQCLHLLIRPANNQVPTVVWYAGAAWSNAGAIKDAAAWHAYVKNFAAALKTPLSITID